MDMGRNASYVLGGAPIEATEASGGRHFTNWDETLLFLTAAAMQCQYMLVTCHPKL